jgi:hypothetical protein
MGQTSGKYNIVLAEQSLGRSKEGGNLREQRQGPQLGLGKPVKVSERTSNNENGLLLYINYSKN